MPEMKVLTVGSLFAGIGGIELGLERTGGFKTVWQVENEAHAVRILEKPWGHVQRWLAVETFLDEIHRNRQRWGCDLLAVSDPCQRNSAAGASSQPSLGAYAVAVAAILRPRLVFRENPTHTRKDAPWPWWRWRTALESIGYGVLPFRLRACCLGADHQRDRMFLLAEDADANGYRLEGRARSARILESMESPGLVAKADWPPIPADRGFDSRAGIPGYVDAVRCLGNAVVPQVAEFIGRMILAAMQETK